MDADKAHQKYAWIMFLLVGVGYLLTTYPFVIGIPIDPAWVKSVTGMTWSELQVEAPGLASAITTFMHSIALNRIGFNVLLIIVAAIPYRKGRKWAWYVLWYVPIYMAIFTWINLSEGGSSWMIFLPTLVLSLLALLLPYRKFFPAKQSEVSLGVS